MASFSDWAWGMQHYDLKVLSLCSLSRRFKQLSDLFKQAFILRKKLGLIDNPDTNCYRLIINSEDGFF
jgi:23S rRNA (cytosine1962-C5)-methyltransferase